VANLPGQYRFLSAISRIAGIPRLGHNAHQFSDRSGTNHQTKVAFKSEFPPRVVLRVRPLTNLRDALICFARLFVAALLAGFTTPITSRADVVGADALVIVNSASAQAILSLAVSNGTGFVNFGYSDNSLSCYDLGLG
jgi:hypothetical protein